MVGSPGFLFPCPTTSPSPCCPSHRPLCNLSSSFSLSRTLQLSLAPQILKKRPQVATPRPGPSSPPGQPQEFQQGPSGWWDACAGHLRSFWHQGPWQERIYEQGYFILCSCCHKPKTRLGSGEQLRGNLLGPGASVKSFLLFLSGLRNPEMKIS